MRADERSEAEVTQLRRVIEAVIGREVPDPVAAEELGQDALVRVIRARPRIDDAGLVAYATAVARNTVRNYHRAERSRRNKDARAAAASGAAIPAVDEAPPMPDPTEAAAVHAGLAGLAPSDRDLLTAIDVDDATIVEVARRHDLREGALRVRLLRARAATHPLPHRAPTCRTPHAPLPPGTRRALRRRPGPPTQPAASPTTSRPARHVPRSPSRCSHDAGRSPCFSCPSSSPGAGSDTTPDKPPPARSSLVRSSPPPWAHGRRTAKQPHHQRPPPRRASPHPCERRPGTSSPSQPTSARQSENRSSPNPSPSKKSSATKPSGSAPRQPTESWSSSPAGPNRRRPSR